MLAELLACYVLQHDPDVDVIWVSGWPVEEVKKFGGAYGYLSRRKRWASDKKTLFIFDDAQMSYKDIQLWNDFFKTMHGYDKRRAIAFTSYGSPTLRVYKQGTPLEWSDGQTVTLRPLHHGDGLPPVGLLFSREEFDDLISRHYPSQLYYFDSSFFDSVFSLTGGHVGAVLGFMTAIVFHDVCLLYLAEVDDLILYFSRTVNSDTPQAQCIRGTCFWKKLVRMTCANSSPHPPFKRVSQKMRTSKTHPSLVSSPLSFIMVL